MPRALLAWGGDVSEHRTFAFKTGKPLADWSLGHPHRDSFGFLLQSEQTPMTAGLKQHRFPTSPFGSWESSVGLTHGNRGSSWRPGRACSHLFQLLGAPPVAHAPHAHPASRAAASSLTLLLLHLGSTPIIQGNRPVSKAFTDYILKVPLPHEVIQSRFWGRG